jgi:hypothetical protein
MDVSNENSESSEAGPSHCAARPSAKPEDVKNMDELMGELHHNQSLSMVTSLST